MDEIQIDEELNQWFSTYGVITSERILGKYQIHLPQKELVAAIRTPTSFYHKLVQVPLKNVLNGIILQQASDYHVYVQKLFIDYLLAGESTKNADGTKGGELSRESIENEQQQLLVLGDEFLRVQRQHDTLIAKSQASFIKIAKEWAKAFELALKGVETVLKNKALESNRDVIRKGINTALIQCHVTQSVSTDEHDFFMVTLGESTKITLTDSLKSELLIKLTGLLNITSSFNARIAEFASEIDELREQARSFRTQFYNTILRVTELLKLVPDYKIDPVQDAINRTSLYFDKSIGDGV